MPTQQFKVGTVEEFDQGRIRLLQVSGREVGIARWEDELFAIRNVCPHAGGPVCGVVRQHLTASQAQMTPVVEKDTPVLACSWHKWEFDLHSGRALFDPRMRVKMYPVSIKADGTVWVEI